MAKKIKIEIKHWVTGKVLFEYECADNTIAKTVEEAVRNDADLGYADLGYADLRSADLRYANLGSANLRYANLRSANLRYANLGYADLGYADLRSANLGSADLGYANLRSADLGYANLRSANLRSANLGSADLGSANLRYADLGYADLGYADLRYANLGSAKNADWAIAITRILPEGDIIGWKKCQDGKLAKLLIPADAKRSHAFGRKCRAEYAEVLEIYKGKRKVKTANSQYDSSFTYEVGATIKPKEAFSEDWTEECASGIHFFITKEEAIHHEL